MFKTMNVNEFYPRWLIAHEKNEAINLIDVRSPEEYYSGHAPGAKLMPLNTLTARLDEIPQDNEVYLICRSGARSAQAADYLACQCGRSNLINIEGGTMAWIEAGYPVEKA